VNAGELDEGDSLLAADGMLLTLAATALEEHPDGIPVFNLRVENSHTYFAAAEVAGSAVLVHNANYGASQKAAAAADSKVQEVAGMMNTWLENSMVIMRKDAKSVVLMNRAGTRKIRLDLQGHGYPPHGHLQVLNPTTGKWVDAPGVPHHLPFAPGP
jgi:hypothetical protein